MDRRPGGLWFSFCDGLDRLSLALAAEGDCSHGTNRLGNILNRLHLGSPPMGAPGLPMDFNRRGNAGRAGGSFVSANMATAAAMGHATRRMPYFFRALLRLNSARPT